MCRADFRADALAPDSRGLGPVRGVAVAGGELRDIAVVHEGVWPYEAGVDAEINEPPCGAQHPSGLAHHRGEVRDIGVREHRDDGVEALVLERERCRVDLEHLDPASPGELELSAGDVDPGHRPAALGEGHRMRSAAAPKVEEPTRSLAEQAENDLARRDPKVSRRELGVVPLRNVVVARSAHAPMLAWPDRGALRG